MFGMIHLQNEKYKLMGDCEHTGADATVRIWDLKTAKCVKVMEGHLAGISALAWSPDGKTIATGADDKVIWLWNVSTVRRLPASSDSH